MRAFISIVTFIILTSCNNSDTQTIKGGQTEIPAIDTTKTNIKTSITVSSATAIIPKSTLENLTVLVLPPYDMIANEGISPDIQKYLEGELVKDPSLTVIKFPYKRLMNVPYQNVFDKKYCKPIIEKIKTDKIVMTKLDQVSRTGSMSTDKWNLAIRIYDTNNGKQINSKLVINELTNIEMKTVLSARHNELMTDIINSN
jgi:hypothetical protein